MKCDDNQCMYFWVVINVKYLLSLADLRDFIELGLDFVDTRRIKFLETDT